MLLYLCMLNFNLKNYLKSEGLKILEIMVHFFHLLGLPKIKDFILLKNVGFITRLEN